VSPASTARTVRSPGGVSSPRWTARARRTVAQPAGRRAVSVRQTTIHAPSGVRRTRSGLRVAIMTPVCRLGVDGWGANGAAPQPLRNGFE